MINFDDHVQLESWEEDEVIIRIINENTQKLIDLEDQRMKTLNTLRDALQTYREFLGRGSSELEGKPF